MADLRQAAGWLRTQLRPPDRPRGKRRTADYSYQTLMDSKWITDRIEFSRRRENLSFSHHKEVAALDRRPTPCGGGILVEIVRSQEGIKTCLILRHLFGRERQRWTSCLLGPPGISESLSNAVPVRLPRFMAGPRTGTSFIGSPTEVFLRWPIPPQHEDALLSEFSQDGFR